MKIITHRETWSHLELYVSRAQAKRIVEAFHKHDERVANKLPRAGYITQLTGDISIQNNKWESLHKGKYMLKVAYGTCSQFLHVGLFDNETQFAKFLNRIKSPIQ